MLKIIIVTLFIVTCVTNLSAQTNPQVLPANPLTYEAYGIVNYYGFNWKTDPQRRNRIDPERFAFEPKYQLNKNIAFEVDIEFEHGGTGASMEFDRFEEFGQYEQSVEKGGEVILEKLAARISLIPELNFLVGHFYLPIGFYSERYEPGYFFTTNVSETEAALLPLAWHENGIEVYGQAGDLRYQLQLINGLDATGFSSANWIKRGYQNKFDYANAENFAMAANVQYRVARGFSIGASSYYGNTSGNRPKPDVTIPAHVFIGTLHSVLDAGPLHIRALAIYGTLQNSAAISLANKGLSNELDVKRTPVGSAAFGAFAEAGYDVFSFLSSAPLALGDSIAPQELIPFLRYDYYDSMFKTEGDIIDNPRWERKSFTAGINYKFHPLVVLKLQFNHREIGIAYNNIEDTFSTGIGFEL
ncbi:MAG: autotransporter outer membrane beta-barrel domain-containing protein [Bacteroidetes bacterium]|nr:autotransporter outer membrane beta-barrel domain-containing protein [Bacteroidota bacterium]